MQPDPAWRLFLGLWPPAAAQAALQAHAGAWRWPESARPTAPERLHVTLHFIGNVPSSRVAQLQQELAVPSPPFALALSRATVWPGGIAVLEPAVTPPPLEMLHQRLQEALRRLELPAEPRRFRPHVTLARRAQGARPPPEAPPVAWPVDGRYLLVRTLPGGRGYAPIQVFG